MVAIAYFGIRSLKKRFVYCQMRGIDAYYADCVQRGALLVSEIADRPFGVRDFRVSDPSGNHIGFGEPLPPVGQR